MTVDRTEVDRRQKHFEQVCRRNGVKLTHQRMEIFKEIAQAGDHPDARQIFQRVRSRMPTVSLDTVYRTLWLLNDLGLIQTLGLSRERTRFDANLSQHHHFVCVRCGSTRDFLSPALDSMKLPESIASFGDAETTHVEVRGVCRQCLKKQRQSHPTNGR